MEHHCDHRRAFGETLPNLFLVVGIPILGVLSSTAVAAAVYAAIGGILEGVSIRRWVRTNALGISAATLVADVLAMAAGCSYILIAGGFDRGVSIALTGVVVAGGSAVLAVVGAVIAAAAYSLSTAQPRLGVRLQVGTGTSVTCAAATANDRGVGQQLAAAADAPANNLYKLRPDVLLKDVPLYVTLVNEGEPSASSAVCRVEFKHVTGVPLAQTGWSVVAPSAGMERAYLWESIGDRTVLASAERPLPALNLEGASIIGPTATVAVTIQADRVRQSVFTLTLTPL